MTCDEWIKAHLPNDKSTLSVDAVELLVKLAWQASKDQDKMRKLRQEEDDKYGDDTGYPDVRRRY